MEAAVILSRNKGDPGKVGAALEAVAFCSACAVQLIGG